jgi:hypothetical protein
MKAFIFLLIKRKKFSIFVGDVEDLGLFFAVDEEVNGKVISKDLRLGGSHMPVTNENRIQVCF